MSTKILGKAALAASLLLTVGCVDSPNAPVQTVSQANSAGAKRYVVTLKNGAGKAAVARHAPILRDLGRVSAVAAELPPAAVNALASDPNIASIEEDAKRYLSGAPTTPPYGLSAVQADQLSGGGVVKVCIIDSGFGAHHEAFDHLDLVVTADEDPVVCKGRNQMRCRGTGDPFYDDNGHGTHVAGTIAGTIGGVNIGVAPNNVSLHIVKVFTADGWAYSSDLAHAADLCGQAGAKVINMSLGGPQAISSENAMFASLYTDGVLSIAAAGNDGNTSHSYPASYDSVMSVAAIDEFLDIADFSQQTDQVEIAAPGVAVLSSTPWNADTRVTIGGSDTPGQHVEFAAFGTASGVLASGALCDGPLPAQGGAVVLCERGVVSFYDKVANAQAAGASAVLIYNNEPGALYATLGEGFSSTIPAMGLSQTDGQALLPLLGSTADVTDLNEFPASGYESWNGTSMATPHVAGVAALVWSKHPTATAAEIRQALTSTAVDLPLGAGDGRDDAFGHGLVQALAADESFPAPCVPSGDEIDHCADNLDNDCDGDIDDADLDCCLAGEPDTELSCNDGIDNDCDGFQDADDDDCAPTCVADEPGKELSCDDGDDNDCDGDIDADDSDCAPQCTLGAPGDSCNSNNECCNGKCKGKPGNKTCN